jgi:hypothetical protein
MLFIYFYFEYYFVQELENSAFFRSLVKSLNFSGRGVGPVRLGLLVEPTNLQPNHITNKKNSVAFSPLRGGRPGFDYL